MAVTTKMKIPYGIYALTQEVTETNITEDFDTERCIYPIIALHSDTKFTVAWTTNIDTQFDTKLRIRNGLSRNRVAFVMQ